MSKAIIKSFKITRDGTPLVLDYTIGESDDFLTPEKLEELMKLERVKLDDMRKEIRRLKIEARKKADSIVEQAEREAARKIDEAQKEIDGMISKAREEAEKILEKARAEGEDLKRESYDRGLREGREEGIRLGKGELAELNQQMETILESAREKRKEVLEGLEEEIVRLALAIAEKVVRADVRIDKNAVLNVVREAISKINERDNVRIRVHPLDVENVRAHKDWFFETIGSPRNVEVLDDPSIQPGGCIIETGFGGVDARVDTQLKSIGDSLLSEDVRGGETGMAE
ncbi:MAG: FliH/SctL family protein [bacterium]